SNVQLHNILVLQNMLASNGLPIVDAGAPDAGRLEVVEKVPMDDACQFEERAAARAGEGRFHVGRLARLFGVDPNHVEEAIERCPQLFETAAGFGGDDLKREPVAEQLA